MRRNANEHRRRVLIGLLLLGCFPVLPTPVSGQTPAGAWWEAETAMDQDGRIALAARPWWQRAQALAVGEHFLIQSTQPDGGRMLVRREQWTTRGKPQPVIVWVIDDDGDMRPDDKDGDKDSDCYVADYDADGTVDRMVDYLDNNADGKPDEMEIRYFDNGRLRRAWFAMDLDGDGHMWKIDRYEYPPGSFFECDAYGDNMIYFNGYDAQRRAWFPASECPFAFYDTDRDGQSEAVVRVSGVPLSFDPASNKDPANDVNYSSAPRTDATRDMGAMNIRYGIDIDALSDAERPLHYDMGFNMIGRLPYRFKGMEHANPLRREPKTTICIPHGSARAMAESYPADQTGFSWREFSDNTERIGFGPHADEGRRWEGIFWVWGRRVMHNTGGPVQEWNTRREFQPTPSTRRVLYYSRVDRRIHLKGAAEGWLRVGHLASQDRLGEVRWFDTNADGYSDRWEVYREGQAAPVRVSTVLDPGVRELPGEWDKLTAVYTQELLPEARRANQQLMAAMRRVDPEFAGSEELAKALAAAPSETEKRYIEDIQREQQYLALREKLLAKSAAWLAKESATERALSRGPERLTDSEAAWTFTQRIARLDVAYGEGRYDQAVEILDVLSKPAGDKAARAARTPVRLVNHVTEQGSSP
jgi:hypothetical protein